MPPTSMKSALLDILSWMRFGTSRPCSVIPPGSPSPVAFNPNDGRALKKLVYDSARNRVSIPMVFWRDAVAHLQPHLALDVGANYGECFSACNYPPGSKVVAIEANPTLMPFLEKTRSAHPARDNIILVNRLVSDVKGKAQPFYFDPAWTGGGSAVGSLRKIGHVCTEVATDSLDGILEELSVVTSDSLVLKVDIEGYEGILLRGFSTLTNFQRVAGILEFSSEMLEKAGTPGRQVYEQLQKNFLVFNTTKRKRELRRLTSWEDLAGQFHRADFHTDLVISRSMADLPPSWTLRD